MEKSSSNSTQLTEKNIFQSEIFFYFYFYVEINSKSFKEFHCKMKLSQSNAEYEIN